MELKELTIQAQIADDLQQLTSFLAQIQPGSQELFNYLRGTTLLHIPCFFDSLSHREIFNYGFQLLHTLGAYNLPVAVGLCMNQYMLSAIATFPLPPDDVLHHKRKAFTEMIRNHRLMLAVSSFDEPVKHQSEPSHALVCTTQPDGSYLFNGVKHFQSNASEADILLFSAVVDQSSIGLFFAPLKNNPHITAGPALFDNAMQESDTRQLVFKDLLLTPAEVFSIGQAADTDLMHLYTRIWFSYMAMAPYLGGASRAMQEGARFLNQVHNEQGTILAQMDGFITDYGRLVLQYDGAMSITSLGGYKLNEANWHNISQWLTDNLPAAGAVKYQVPDACEYIVQQVRRIIGARSQFKGHILNKLTQEIVFGPLHPVINARLERHAGSDFLNQYATPPHVH